MKNSPPRIERGRRTAPRCASGTVIWSPGPSACLFLLVMAVASATVGCGRSASENPPAASIGAGTGASASSKSAKSAQADYDAKHPQVVIDTSLGSITLRLDAEKSPITVANFLYYAEKGLYNQTIFHQVYKDQAIIAGGYTTNLSEIPAQQPVRNEADNGLKNRRGTIAMLRHIDAIDSATSQFFINLVDNPALDYRGRAPEEYGYCVFGEVVSGMEVANDIANSQVRDTDQFDRTPVRAVVVKSIRRVK
jgi:cyclophilin family peptidyl-prolyl cis-trans isomerase